METALMGNGVARRLCRLAVPPVCFAAVGWGVWSYPLPGWPLAVALLVYAAALWRWTALFLIVVPAVLPAFDLGLWTGWTLIAESDLFILTTIGVLAARGPPRRALGLPERVVLSLLVVSVAISTAIGLATQAQWAAFSSNPYLRPDNALRLAKPFVEILALWPFMRQRHLEQGDMAAWLGWGMLAGAFAVAVETTIERAVFPGVFDFQSGYRVSAAFSSMNVGGGHIGAYMAMTLPFLLGAILTTRSWLVRLMLLIVATVAGYALVVTFAWIAWFAAIGSVLLATIAGWRFLPKTAGQKVLGGMAALLIFAVLAGVVAATLSGYMRGRLMHGTAGLLARQSNLVLFETIRDTGAMNLMFGHGLGSYPRGFTAPDNGAGPSDFRLEESEGTRYLTIATLTPLSISQKISPSLSGKVRLTMSWRAASPNAVLGLLICEQLLLSSQNCRGENVKPQDPGHWEPVSIEMSLAGLNQENVLRPPVQLSVFGATPGTTLSVRHLSLIDDWGWELLANGDFREDMNRWTVTDDRHTAWRMFNLYLVLLFETGILGLASFVALAGLAITGGIRALRRGEPMGAAIIGSIISFLISGLVDNVMEAPRLLMVFLMVCAGGLCLREIGAGSWNGEVTPLKIVPSDRPPHVPPLEPAIGEIEEL
jgi:hypothetical protein